MDAGYKSDRKFPGHTTAELKASVALQDELPANEWSDHGKVSRLV